MVLSFLNGRHKVRLLKELSSLTTMAMEHHILQPMMKIYHKKMSFITSLIQLIPIILEMILVLMKIKLKKAIKQISMETVLSYRPT